jgi:hypothetical protein
MTIAEHHEKPSLGAALRDSGITLDPTTRVRLELFHSTASTAAATDLCDLLLQNDPRNGRKKELKTKLRAITKDTHNNLAQWLQAAVRSYPDVEAMVYQRDRARYGGGTPDTNVLITANEDNERTIVSGIIEGSHHYYEDNPSITAEQVKDLILIAAAVELHWLTDYINITKHINNDTILCHRYQNQTRCTAVHSHTIRTLAADHTTATRILSIIQNNNVITEAGILHLLNNGPSALTQGSL